MVVPEIVQLEVEEILTARMLEFKRKIEDGHRNLLPVLGSLQPVQLPSDDDIGKAVVNIIPDFDVPIQRLPFNVDVARSSTMKLLRRIAPSEKSEQFRDGVIWAHCLELLDSDDVYLVSEDKDFYHQRDYSKGLATELDKEMKSKSNKHQVELRRDLAHLLDDIRMPIQLDNVRLFFAIREQQRETVDEIMHSNGFRLCGHVEGEVKCFATEDAQKVYLAFSLVHPCHDSTGDRRRPGKLKLKGSGFLDPETGQTSDIRLSNILLKYPDWEPGGPARGAVLLEAHFNAPTVHEIRFPIDNT